MFFQIRVKIYGYYWLLICSNIVLSSGYLMISQWPKVLLLRYHVEISNDRPEGGSRYRIWVKKKYRYFSGKYIAAIKFEYSFMFWLHRHIRARQVLNSKQSAKRYERIIREILRRSGYFSCTSFFLKFPTTAGKFSPFSSNSMNESSFVCWNLLRPA